MNEVVVEICQAGCGWSGAAGVGIDVIGGPASAAGECQSQLRDAELFIITMLYSRVLPERGRGEELIESVSKASLKSLFL